LPWRRVLCDFCGDLAGMWLGSDSRSRQQQLGCAD
jgi:hypothetical protein